jgi:uncharacterized integral membrane protein
MLTFIVILVLGLVIAFFAGQNTAPTTIFLLNSQLPTLPLYTVIIGSMLIGFVISWVVNLIDSVFRMFVLRGKENVIKEDRKQFARLDKRIHELEIENARLKGENKEPIIIERPEEHTYNPSFFDRLKHAVR